MPLLLCLEIATLTEDMSEVVFYADGTGGFTTVQQWTDSIGKVHCALINSGKFPDIRNEPQTDFFFVDAQDPEKALSHILTLVTQ